MHTTWDAGDSRLPADAHKWGRGGFSPPRRRAQMEGYLASLRAHSGGNKRGRIPPPHHTLAHRPAVRAKRASEQTHRRLFCYTPIDCVCNQASRQVPSQLGPPQPPRRPQQPRASTMTAASCKSPRILQNVMPHHSSIAMGGLNRPRWADSTGALAAVAGDSADDGRER